MKSQSDEPPRLENGPSTRGRLVPREFRIGVIVDKIDWEVKENCLIVKNGGVPNTAPSGHFVQLCVDTFPVGTKLHVHVDKPDIDNGIHRQKDVKIDGVIKIPPVEVELHAQKLKGAVAGNTEVESSGHGRQLFVRTLSGKIITIDVAASDRMGRVKEMIHEREGVPVSLQRLKCNGYQLNDESTVFECGIKHGTTVELLLRICGGSDQDSSDEDGSKQKWDEGRRKKPGWKRALTRVRNQALEEFRADPEDRMSRAQYDKEFDAMMEKFEDLMTVGEKLGFKNDVAKLQKEKEELEDKYDEFQKIREKHIKEELEIPVGRTRADSDAGRSYALRPLELPKFGGVQKEYESWSATMQVCVAKSHMDEKEKLLYLRQSLTGEPRLMVEKFGFQDGAFVMALASLGKRYGGEETNVSNVLREIEKLSAIKDDCSEDLEAVLRVLDQLVFLFKAKKEGELGKGAFYHMIVKKFSHQLLRNWEREMDNSKKTNQRTSIEFMREWLSKELNYLKKTEEVLKETKSENKRKSTFYSEVKGSRSEGSRTASAGNKRASCYYCQDEHYVNQCRTFAELDIHKRREIARQRRWCFNCLRPGHQVKECEKPRFCSKSGCAGKHHRLLHSEKKQSDEEDETRQRGKREDKSTLVTTNVNFGDERKTQDQRKYVTLRTLPIVVIANGRELEVNALLDDASSVSYVSQRVAQELRLGGQASNITVNVIGGKAEKLSVRASKMEVASMNRKVRVDFQALTIKTISEGVQVCDWQKICHRWKHLENIPFPSMSRKAGIDVLIGADHIRLHEAIREVQGQGNAPVARLTPLGWTCMGTVNERSTEMATCFNTLLTSSENSEDCLTRFWEVEEIDVQHENTAGERQIISQTIQNCEHKEGRYHVKLPFKGQWEHIQDTRWMAERREELLMKRLKKDERLQKRYNDIILEYEKKGYIQEIVRGELNRVKWWLPHFPIVREDKATTKVRIVFDAAAKCKGQCLNDLIEAGPKLQNDLLEVLLRFRRNAIALITDVHEMYLQIAVTDADSWYLCFMHENDGVKRYFKFARLVFGLNVSPFLAQLISRISAEEFINEYPEAVDIVKHSTYMDDTMFSVMEVDEAKQRKLEVAKIWENASMKTEKWMTNSKEVLATIPKMEQSKVFELTDKESRHVKALGVVWEAEADTLAINVGQLEEKVRTKRSFLRVLARIFDPMGLFSSYTVKGKILMQEIWMTGLDWDQELPRELIKKIDQWTSEMQMLKEVKCKRAIFRWADSKKQIHIFSDASIDAYAAVAFAVEQRQAEVRSNFIMAKTKVAPVKVVSIPRLELLGACLGVKMAQKISKAVGIDVKEFIFWCDSEDVLIWIRQHGKLYKPFVANRIGFIQEITAAGQWKYVPSSQNAADVLSRGQKKEDYANFERWFKGPNFLKQEERYWPAQKEEREKKSTDEERRKCTSLLTQIFDGESYWKVNCLQLETYSSWTRMIRARAFLRRFVRNCQKPRADRIVGSLTTEETTASEEEVIKQDQRVAFKDELNRIQENKFVGERSSLKGLTPFIDDQGVLRSQSRLMNVSWLPYKARCPIILSGKNWIARLLVTEKHEQMHHFGSDNHLLAEMNKEFWILGGRRLIQQVKRKCYVCQKFRRKGSVQLMAPIPKFRLEEKLCAFAKVGIDYAGPFLTKQGRRLVREKRYMCLITCLQTRAVHIEMAWGLDTDSLVRALQRFSARRGTPVCIISDNGTNFVGATNELKTVQVDTFSLRNGFKGDRITWLFNPPGTPHFGGIFEVLVREAKKAMVKILGETEVSDEELMTMFIEVEKLLNGRPLVSLYKEDEKEEVLTPNHFIRPGFDGVGQPKELTARDAGLRRRWRRIQELTDQWWTRWRTEVIPNMRRRNKWMKEGPEIRVGEIVWQLEDGNERGKWNIGRVLKLFPGEDGRSRVVLVRSGGKDVLRSVGRICPLEVRD